jgi:hypothetical protein
MRASQDVGEIPSTFRAVQGAISPPISIGGLRYTDSLSLHVEAE